MGNRNGSILRPDAMNVETTTVQGPLAQPAVVVLQQPGAVKVLTIGGLTKVEQLAAMEFDHNYIGSQSAHAVDIAEAILAECERRRAPKETP